MKTHLFIILFFFSIHSVYAQTDKEKILKLRHASNQAIEANDFEKVYTFLTDDVLITTGSGTLLSGKDDLREYILNAGTDHVYFKRSPDEIQVNPSRGLAWEKGTWKVYYRDKIDHSYLGGYYAAMWTNESGSWLIKSQLFVSL